MAEKCITCPRVVEFDEGYSIDELDEIAIGTDRDIGGEVVWNVGMCEYAAVQDLIPRLARELAAIKRAHADGLCLRCWKMIGDKTR